MATLSFDPAAYEHIIQHLRSHDTEKVVFLFFAQLPELAHPAFQVVDYYIVPADELVFESRFHAEVTGDAQAKVIKMAWDKRLALAEIHSHPGGGGGSSFSPSDLAGFSEFVPHVRWRLKGAPYIALVFDQRDFDALVWIADPHTPEPLIALQVGEQLHSPTGITFAKMRRQALEAERYSRQIALFGALGQDRIQQQHVTIVGLGGLGCHVVQQLAYLGVIRFTLVDGDAVDLTNLNRLVTATEADIGKSKVDVAVSLIRSVQPNAIITVVSDSLFTRDGFAAIKNCDLAFGCVDDDGVRLGLLELCCAYQKPYIDLATDVESDGSFGGRLIFTGIGKGCLFCKDELDQKEIWRFFASPEQRHEDDQIYGVDRSALGISGPSVVSINGVIASLAVTEFSTFATGLRAPQSHLIYRGSMGIVTKVDATASDCYYCGDVWNRRAKPDLSRLLSVQHSGRGTSTHAA